VTGSADPARRKLLIDTHVLIWLTEGDRQLGLQALGALRLAYREHRALVSAITPWEIALLVSKGRLRLGRDVLDWVRLKCPGSNCPRSNPKSRLPAHACHLKFTQTPPTAFSSQPPGTWGQHWSPQTARSLNSPGRAIFWR